MRESKFTEAEIVQALRQVSAGTPAAQICRTLGITETTFYRWRQKYDVAATNIPHEMRKLRDENAKLKQIVANLLLDNQALTESGRKK